MTGTKRPILLKKSAVVFKAEKYASEIEILDVRRAFQAEISRRGVLKRSFHLPILRQPEKPDFFNRIGQKPPFVMCRKRLKQPFWAGTQQKAKARPQLLRYAGKTIATHLLEACSARKIDSKNSD